MSLLLITYKDHIASRIWNGEVTCNLICVETQLFCSIYLVVIHIILFMQTPSRMLSVHNHSRTHKEWKIEHDFLKDLLRKTGLIHIAENFHTKFDEALCSAFVERFYPETNTFHFSFGEMTITLLDLSKILGLKIDGLAVHGKTPRELELIDLAKLVSKYLNISVVEVNKEFQRNNKGTLTLSWLKKHWMGINDASSDEEKEAASRAYMLHFIGSVLCPDKSKNAVGAYWIQCLEDISNLESVSFGSAILSYLFHQLGSASRHGTHTLTGCITLLQVLCLTLVIVVPYSL